MDTTSITTCDGENVTVSADGVITITELNGKVTALTVSEAIALARCADRRQQQAGQLLQGLT